jgi:membrane protein DedA with SNARE-associated domain
VRQAHEPTLFESLWKYMALGATSIIGEETNPILGGIAAHEGKMSVFAVIVAIAIGTWVASIGLYYIGYGRIAWVRSRWPQKERLIDTALDIVRRHPWRSALAVRFAYGLRLPVPIACGAARMPLMLYVIASGISCWVWAIIFTYVGLAFGGTAMRALHFMKRMDVRLGIFALILIVVLAIMYRRRIVTGRNEEGHTDLLE